MSRETLRCVFQVLSFGMDPLFWVCQKAKIWSPCMVEPVLKYTKRPYPFANVRVDKRPARVGQEGPRS